MTEETHTTTTEKKESRNAHTLHWQALEFTYIRKTNEWYWVVGIMTIGIAVAAYFLNNFLFTILALLGGFSLALFGAKKPEMLDMEISSKGVRVMNKLYPYSNLEIFWISEVGSEPKILFTGTGLLHTHITLPLGDMDPEDVRDELTKYLDEEEIAEPMIQRVIDQTGF